MHFDMDPELLAFREEIRQFAAENLTDEMKARQKFGGGLFAAHDDEKAWVKLLAKKGWEVYSWPAELGGLDWSPMKKFVFEDELYQAYAPPLSFNLLHMIGPVIIRYGSEQQKTRFLPMMRAGEISWAQGFSEPGAGSDLASLRTRADRSGDKYIINGSKIWTSGAHEAEWGFFLVKTDTTCKPQLGMSFLLVDMKTPGITVRTIPQINNDDEHLCEVFLENVEVPVENLVGEAGMGWTYAKNLLEGERTSSSYIFWNKREMRRLIALAQCEVMAGNPVASDPVFRARLARIQAELTALEWSVLRVLANEDFAYGASAAASVLKLRGSELQQAITEAQVDVLGERALRVYSAYARAGDAGTLWSDSLLGVTNRALMARASTIYGGAKQIQKNIIAKAAFGL